MFSDFAENYDNQYCDNTGVVNETINSTATAVMTSVTEAVTGAATNVTQGYVDESYVNEVTECLRENSLLFMLLMLGTLWLSISLYNFTKT